MLQHVCANLKGVWLKQRRQIIVCITMAAGTVSHFIPSKYSESRAKRDVGSIRGQHFKGTRSRPLTVKSKFAAQFYLSGGIEPHT